MSVATTVAERQQLVEEWTSSGLTQREFGRLHDVKVWSLNRWVLAIRRGERGDLPQIALRVSRRRAAAVTGVTGPLRGKRARA